MNKPTRANKPAIPNGTTNPTIDRLDAVAKTLAGSFTLVTAALTALGATGGGLERMLLNHQEAALFAFRLIVAGIFLAILALALPFHNWPNSGVYVELLVILVSGALFSWGIYEAINAAGVAPLTRQRPRISASLKISGNSLLVSATLRANGVKASDHFLVLVSGFENDSAASDQLYWSQTGPDSMGLVDISIELPIESKYSHVTVEGQAVRKGAVVEEGSCRVDDVDDGCAVLRVPRLPEPTPTSSPSLP